MIKTITPILLSITAIMSIAHFYAIKDVEEKVEVTTSQQTELNDRVVHTLETLSKRVEQNTDNIEQLTIAINNIVGE